MHLVGLGKPLEQKLILSNIKLDLFKSSHIFLTSFPFSSETHTMTGRAGLRMAPRAKSRLFNRSPQLGAYCQSGRGVGLELGLYLISSVLSPLSERQVLCSVCLRLLTQLSLALRSHILKTPSHPRIKGFQRRMHISVKGIFIFSNILVVALRIYLAQ